MYNAEMGDQIKVVCKLQGLHIKQLKHGRD